MLKLNILSFLIFSQTVNAIIDKVHFAKYLNIDSEEGFTLYNSKTILNVVIDRCIEACKATKECRFINYHVNARTCTFIGVKGGNGFMLDHNLEKKKGYVFGDKSEWKVETNETCSKCEGQGRCAKDNLGNDESPLCRDSGCGPPPVLSGSYFSGNMLSIGNKVLYKCEPNYVQTGDGESMCLENGTWSLSKSVCLLDCGHPEAIVHHGRAIVDEPGTTAVGSTATVNCNDGYKTNLNKITCLNNGTWENAICFLIDCGHPEATVDFGRTIVDEPGTTTVGSTATVICNVGYKPNLNRITCLNNSTWENAMCLLIDCGHPEATVDYGSAIVDEPGTTTVGSTATVNCTVGYKPNLNKIACLDNGLWEHAMCFLIECGYPAETVDHGWVIADEPGTSTVGSTAAVSCKVGYKPNRSKIACLTNGTWENAICSPLDCGMAEEIDNGAITLDEDNMTTVGATATVNCNDGYTPVNSAIACQVDGTWQKALCVIDCGEVPKVENGDVIIPKQTSVGAEARVNCEECYTSDKPIIECLNNGSCELPTCSLNIPILEDGTNYTTVLANTTMQFITSQNYPDHYENDLTQHWLIRKPTRTASLSLSFLDMQLEKGYCVDRITIYTLDWNCARMSFFYQVCVETNPPDLFNNWSVFIWVTFKSDSSNTGKGFKMGYRIIDG